MGALENDLDYGLELRRKAYAEAHPGATLTEILVLGSTYDPDNVTGNMAFDWFKTEQVINSVRNEGHKARHKHGDAALATDAEALSVLVEEVGEVAKAINQRKPEEVKKELIQVASVAIRHLSGDLTFSEKP